MSIVFQRAGRGWAALRGGPTCRFSLSIDDDADANVFNGM